ncbi:hypothetical protein [Micromonospora rhizosphaerae]|uniref:hypothetical protein n=1 Tax=Micromonospora rhizosphaerae TaxID=568872 RepID=UPI00159F0B55|nr:hypothetical protein [Micromonospora rhizosphaerae]
MTPWTAAEKSNPPATSTQPGRAQVVDQIKEVAADRAPLTDRRIRPASGADRYRVTVDLGAGCGLRQGEIFGVSPDDVDRVRRVLHVTRQVKLVRGRLIIAPPEGGKVRHVPLPESVSRRLAEHAKRYPPVDVTLPRSTTPSPATRRRLTAWRRHDHGNQGHSGCSAAGQRTCADHLALK